MSRRTRLQRLEMPQTPPESVLSWVREVQQFSRLNDYAMAVIDGRRGAPLDHVMGRIASEQRLTVAAGDPSVRAALRKDLRDAVFLYCVVLEVNAIATEVASRTEPLIIALRCQLQLLGTDPRSMLEGGDEAAAGTVAVQRAWLAWHANVRTVLAECDAADVARQALQHRYFEQQSVLFPETADGWKSVRQAADRLASMIDGLPSFFKAKLRQAPQRRKPIEAADLGADLELRARAAAFELLGERDAALGLWERQLRQLAAKRV